MILTYGFSFLPFKKQFKNIIILSLGCLVILTVFSTLIAFTLAKLRKQWILITINMLWSITNGGGAIFFLIALYILYLYFFILERLHSALVKIFRNYFSPHCNNSTRIGEFCVLATAKFWNLYYIYRLKIISNSFYSSYILISEKWNWCFWAIITLSFGFDTIILF